MLLLLIFIIASLALDGPPGLTLISLLVNHHILDREFDNETLLLSKQRRVVVQPPETSQSMGMCRVLQETVSLGSELLCVSVDAVLGPNNLGLLHKHALVPALGLLLGREMRSLAVLDLVLELLNSLHSQLAELLLIHLQWQVADRETGLGDEERWVTGQQGATSREGCLTLGQFTGQDRGRCGRVGEDDTLTHEVQIAAILTLALVLSSLEQRNG